MFGTGGVGCHDLILAREGKNPSGEGPLAHPPEPAYPCCLPALGELAGLTPCEGSVAQSSQPTRQPKPGWPEPLPPRPRPKPHPPQPLVPEVDVQPTVQLADPDGRLGMQPDADADDTLEVACAHPGLEHRVA